VPAVPEKIEPLTRRSRRSTAPFARPRQPVKTLPTWTRRKTQALTETLAELRVARKACEADARRCSPTSPLRGEDRQTASASNDQQHAARKAFDPVAERDQGTDQAADLIYKLASPRTASHHGGY